MKQRKKSNGILLAIIAVPVVLCVVMAVVFYTMSNKKNNDVPDGSDPNGITSGDIGGNTEAPNTDDTLPSSPDGTETPSDTSSGEPNGEVTSPTGGEPIQSDDSRIPDTRPTTPEVPITSQPEDGNSDNSAEIDESAWNLILVNPWNKAPEGFTVELASYNASHSVDARILDDLRAMMDAMKSDGLSPIICSSYRTNAKQQSLFDRQVQSQKALGLSDEEARKEAGRVVAVPGTSEHETGLAVDIVALSYQMLDEKQEETEEQKWLIKNCYDYGFILRYPNGKSDITGIIYEPWHYRYVGKDIAPKIRDSGLTFEEWLDANK